MTQYNKDFYKSKFQEQYVIKQQLEESFKSGNKYNFPL